MASDCQCVRHRGWLFISVAPSSAAEGLHSFTTDVEGTADWRILAKSFPFREYHVFTIFDARPDNPCCFSIELAVRSAQYPAVPDLPLPTLTHEGIDLNINTRRNTISWRSTNKEEVNESRVERGDCLVVSVTPKAYVTQPALFPVVELRNATGEDDGLRVIYLNDS